MRRCLTARDIIEDVRQEEVVVPCCHPSAGLLRPEGRHLNGGAAHRWAGSTAAVHRAAAEANPLSGLPPRPVRCSSPALT